ncbi:polysaccharide biosynthesis/export family protein [Trichothermofontia sichuanensis B231]|uniref:polysaccharide biosynthesis/export family protein n=1 Tax=Trichothermofontia sichuanensis TaxID=3045816 RepID=UPI002246FC2E|nr:polysaccharide biosynthesis/export family protein [Trichothermofontia sichuanensis]UZQ55983.1 polysaccharide biosynthesis/export family protein [Trichothermofontia sichuanensis B231]
MEMQDFLRYFPPMAALSVASFSGGHLLRDPAALSQGPQVPIGPTTPSPRIPPKTPPTAPANSLTASSRGIHTQIAIPEAVPPELALVDAEALLVASNQPYPIPELPQTPSLSAVFAQVPPPVPAQVSPDPVLIHTSVQALSASPLETMMTAEVASIGGGNPENQGIEPGRATGDISFAEPGLPVIDNGSNNDSVAPLPNSPLAATPSPATAAPTPETHLHNAGILVAALLSPETGSALQLAPLQAVTAYEQVDAVSSPPQPAVATTTSPPSLVGTPEEDFPKAVIDIPVPPPESGWLADTAPTIAEKRATTPDSPSPRHTPPSPVRVASSKATSIAQSLTPSIAPDYTLGPGDRVFVDIFNVPEYSKSYQVMVDGTLSLPRIGRLAVAGLTLDQASALISDRYRQFFVEPLTTLVLEQARPVTVALSGEINRPGSYQFKPTETGAFPTLTQAIRQAEGITQTADLRRVEIRRPQANGLEQVIEVNLWDLVQSSNLAQDITLRDGDMIRIAPAPTLTPTQRSQLAEANFAPATIRVNVIGEVVRPGVVEITPNTPLNQAVLRAGGFVNGRANRQAVELIRLQPNGTIQRRTIAVDLADGVNEATNPILQPNDVVLVTRSRFARTADTISQVTAPTLFLLNLLRLF